MNYIAGCRPLWWYARTPKMNDRFICKDIVDKKEVAWAVAFEVNHKPNYLPPYVEVAKRERERARETPERVAER